MKSPLKVLFLWHMHQPLYIDPFQNRFCMPWVRLHAIKAYSDMIAILEENPSARVTVNLVPSLLAQIDAYCKGMSDDFLDISRKPASELTTEEQNFILTRFFSCNWPTMVYPYPRYSQLLSLRGKELDPTNLNSIRNKFSPQDLLDLQVWFNLTWVGFSSRKDPFIKGLFKKERLFTEEEKNELLDFHLKLLSTVTTRYKTLWEKGQIELSTSPFYHPILPLLIDTDCAKRAMPHVNLPPRFHYPEDAKEHLLKAKEYFKEHLGKEPIGLWPSEGSVSPELIPIIQETGFKWAATDEEILFHSLDHHDATSLFQPYRVEVEGGNINMIFRHHRLSDLVGFVYQKNDPNQAVEDFIARLSGIQDICQGMDRSAIVAVILDGENPWEYYPDGGEAFLTKLYDKLSEHPEIDMMTISEAIEQHPPQKSLTRLHTGSWINHDFGIWIGGVEENKAWSYLGKARTEFERIVKQKNDLDQEAISQAKEAIMAAEGSDWFWWYGDQFVSDFAFEFDRLFRAHLQHMYKCLGLWIPEDLNIPIRRAHEVIPSREPRGFIQPEIDGKLSHYLEWTGSGLLILSDRGGAMHQGQALLKEIRWGFDLENFYLRLDPRNKGFSEWEEDTSLSIIQEAKEKEFRLILKLIEEAQEGSPAKWELEFFIDGEKKDLNTCGVKWAAHFIVEISVPFSCYSITQGEHLKVYIEVAKGGLVQDRWPRQGYIVVTRPDEDYERRIWLV